MIAIVEYGAGNQTSVRRAFDHLGIPCRITADSGELAAADGIVFPGVGAAGQAMRLLRERGLDREIARLAGMGRPLLGICLGCQILLEASAENDTAGLGLVPGSCERLPGEGKDEGGRPLRIPHMGWNNVRLLRPSPLFAGIDDETEFYFVHGYYAKPAPELVLATARYGLEFCAAYGRDGLWAVQFHPEKSGPAGLRLLDNFARCCGRFAHA